MNSCVLYIVVIWLMCMQAASGATCSNEWLVIDYTNGMDLSNIGELHSDDGTVNAAGGSISVDNNMLHIQTGSSTIQSYYYVDFDSSCASSSDYSYIVLSVQASEDVTLALSAPDTSVQDGCSTREFEQQRLQLSTYHPLDGAMHDVLIPLADYNTIDTSAFVHAIVFEFSNLQEFILDTISLGSNCVSDGSTDATTSTNNDDDNESTSTAWMVQAFSVSLTLLLASIVVFLA